MRRRHEVDDLDPGVTAESGRGCWIGGKEMMVMVRRESCAADDDFRFVFGNSLDLVAPFSDGFDGGFDSFGPGIHGQDLVGIGEVAEFFVERTELVVAEGAGGEGEFLACSTMAFMMRGLQCLVDGGIGGQAVHVFCVTSRPDAVTAFNDDIEGL